MMTLNLKALLRGVAMSALLNGMMPVAEAWAAEEVQVLRKAPAVAGVGAVPFTTFQQEELAVTQSLPCKWISKDGRLGPSYGSTRYDFLCKGGDFATVSLYLDKASSGTGVGKVRLLYRDFPVNTNPNAGEAIVAQQFLQHVTGRFVPAARAGEVMDAFWGNKNRKWAVDGLNIRFEVEKGEQFNVRRLEVEGTGQLRAQTVPLYPVDGGLSKDAAATQVKVYIQDSATVPGVAKNVPVTHGMAPITPTSAGLTKPMPIPVNAATEIDVLKPTVVMPLPGKVLPQPGVGVNVPDGKTLTVPGTAPAGEVPTQGLVPATPAELNTAPAPESMVTPVAPPELSSTLVPNATDLKAGYSRAPSNFDVYNKAMELTKDVEAKAQVSRVEQAKVTASKAVSETEALTESSIVAPQTPQLQPAVKETPAQAAGEGLGVAPKPALEDIGQPINYQGPRSSEPRPLPQLKFVPKAEPLRPANEVLQFEDEGSKL